MRHLLGNIITYAIAGLLFLGAALFARMRASQYTLTHEAAVLATYEPSPRHEFLWRELGPETYRRNCRSCHGADGRGWDQYPSLATAAEMLHEPDGRGRLIDVLLFGLSKDGSPVPMPRMGHLHDVQIAAVLNHILTAFGSIAVAADSRAAPDADHAAATADSAAADTARLFTPAEVRRRRR